MDNALKHVLVPELRRRGFTGSLPHFRRRDAERISLLSIQHFSSGGSFFVNLATCSPCGYRYSWGEEIAPSKVTAPHVHKPRERLGADLPDFGVYSPRNYEPGGDVVQPDSHYSVVAERVVAHLDEAEAFWQLPYA